VSPAALLAALLALAAGPLVADPSPPPVDPPAQQAPVAVVDRTPTQPDLDENSALAVSPSHPGVLWTLEDSDNPAVLYAVGRDGATQARLTVADVPARDWEALAVWRDASGRALIAIGDLGDNAARRPQIEIDVLAEPAALRSATVRPQHRIVLRYPDRGAADAETLLVDPRTSRIYVVTKGLLAARIWAVPTSAWPGTGQVGPRVQATLEPVGGIGLQLATDGVVLPSGHVLVRSYAALALLAPLEGGAPVHTLATVPLPAQPQGEGLAATASTIYLSSEGAGTPILRAAMPPSFAAAMRTPAASGSPSPTPAAAATEHAPTGDEGSSVAGGSLGQWSVPVGAGVGLLALLGCVLVVVRRRRPG